MAAQSPFVGLPFDVLEAIFPYLQARDFLALASTCRTLYEVLYNDPGYWSHATQSAFRVRNRPAVQNDGALWRKLHRRLYTQTKVYLWGQETTQEYPKDQDLANHGVHNYGTVADIQCGGWCTAILNDKGQLFTKGRINGEAFPLQRSTPGFVPLTFPADVNGANITIRQFSAGRAHVLGLSDAGDVWLWESVVEPAFRIPLLESYISEANHAGTAAGVSRVVAGWDRSSVYIRGKGIIVWPFVSRDFERNWNDMTTYVVPRTSFFKSTTSRPNESTAFVERLGPQIEKVSIDDAEDEGEVTGHIVLEDHVLFCTEKGRVYAHKSDQDISRHLGAFHDIIDLHGSFRTFGVIEREGGVITSSTGYLEAAFEAEDGSELTRESDDGQTSPSSYLQRYPALQNSGVLQLAFGDYHFHALHANGRITSYGRDPSSSGALGLGKYKISRGVTTGILGSNGIDGTMLPSCYVTGRTVWFHEDQQKWADWMTRLMQADIDRDAWDDSGIQHVECIGRLSEWVEFKGNDWEKHPSVEKDDDLGAHFALAVAAGGWRGCALVLVNQALVDSVSKAVGSGLCGPADQDPLPHCPNIRIIDGRPLLGFEVDVLDEPPPTHWGFRYTSGWTSVYGVPGFLWDSAT